MRVLSLELTDVRHFPRKRLEFHPGFNLLVGENGAGKSTVLRSLLTALGRGENFRSVDRLGDDDIRHRAPELQVRVECQIGDKTGATQITHRWRQPTKRKGRLAQAPVLWFGSNEAAARTLTEMRLAAGNGLTGENASKAQVKVLSVVRDKVMALKLIFIELDNEDDAYLIFETLNTRGKDLKTGDLVKNHITKHLRGKNANLDSVKDKWNKLVETLEESEADLDLDEFLHHYWLSVADYLAAKNLFKTIRKTITAAKCKEFLDALVRDSVHYRSLFEPSSKKWTKNEFGLRNSLMALSQFKVSQHAPFVLALLREYSRKRAGLAEVRNALRMLESFHFVFTAITAQRSGGSLAKWYSDAGRDYSRATDAAARQKVIADLRKRLKSVLPSEAEFEIRFLNLLFLDDVTKQKKLVQYVLGSVSAHYSHGVAIDGDQMTIEHVAAQNAAAGAAAINKTKVGNIGNLLYVSSALNDKLGNRSFADKLKVLAASKVPMDPYIANPARTSWTEADIDARAKELSKLAYQTIWKI